LSTTAVPPTANPAGPVAAGRSIHLLYVPTMACNLHCSYCYLGAQTTMAGLRVDAGRAVATLRHALGELESAGVLAFNVSLHGGEVTMLPEPVLDELFTLIRQYYRRHFDAITALGHRRSAPHIKTNLYRFAALHDLLDRHRVSVSASIDLPLALHARHRRTRSGRSWLRRTEEQVRLLGRYPHAKKISATLSAEHLADLPALVADIRYLHDELGFDMTNFNVMFAFPSALNAAEHGGAALTPAWPAEQLALYDALAEAFTGSDLEEGLRRHWFEEFTPSYCTNAVNCGERFYLLQGDGSVYSCVRGQGIAEFRYGNVFDDPVDTILANGADRIAAIHQRFGFDPGCRACGHLPLCNTGCPVVKFQRDSGRSYTCDLQRAIYRDQPLTHPASDARQLAEYAWSYGVRTHPAGTVTEQPPPPPESAVLLPGDLGQAHNGLRALIAADPVLVQLYRDDAWIMEVGGERLPLRSQIIKTGMDCRTLVPGDRVRVHLRRELLAVACAEPIRNTVYLQLLRDTPVVYGDDRRTKQEHLFTYQRYANCLAGSDLGADWATLELTDLLAGHRDLYRRGVRNNLFVTTGHLRDYHYAKQRDNAFYHIQAINLPFQNFEFHYLTGTRP
jgi:uncharacterized protein